MPSNPAACRVGRSLTMEKMPSGFAPDFGDWRYAMIMPNGKLFGITGGVGNRAVEFCGECRLQVAERDHLFELPEEYLRSGISTRRPV